MPVAQIQDVDFHGHAAIEIAGGAVAAVILPGLGGRVIELRLHGQDLLWHDPRLAGGPGAIAALPRPVWWGGWKTWIAPQASWPGHAPPRDLDEGTYATWLATAGDSGPVVRLTSPICAQTGLQVVREIGLDAARDTLEMNVTLTNRAGPPGVEAAIWEVIQVRRPAVVRFDADPRAFPDEGGVRTYTQEKDSLAARADRVLIASDANGTHVDVLCNAALRFKFGAVTPPARGRIRAVLPEHGGRSMRLSFDAPPGARYAHEANVEVYCSDEAPYCEIEAHAPFAPLGRGDTVRASFTLELRVPQR